ncbi:MAG: alpha-L-fucosidase [Clostridiales bacterium]|mgnify:CR=1 FL=1|nr:alpha-L-fucosidase [Clostridiales bacterium]
MTTPTPSSHVAAFERLGFGMFIHWGIYASLGMGEKTLHFNKIPRAEYRELMKRFTASRFDTREIARLAKDSGMRYITLTARHHDGFSLFDTRGLNDYDAPHSACRRDLVGEFVEACRAEGIAPFLYHTTLDWWQDSFESDFPAYLDYLHESVELLCRNYGKLGGLWFDGNWSKRGADWQEDRLYGMIRRYQPEAMIINNTGIGRRGEAGHPELDSLTFENGRPGRIDREGAPKYLAAEMCQTMNTRWGFGSLDFSYKSPAEIIETLCVCRRYGANYLLNVSPDGEGEIPLIQRAILGNTAAWIAHCPGEVIYTGRPAEIECDDCSKDFALSDSGELYLFIHDLGAGGDRHIVIDGAKCGIRRFTGIPGRVLSARWTDNGEELSFTQSRSEDALELYCTPYPYAQNHVVRVCRLTVEQHPIYIH